MEERRYNDYKWFIKLFKAWLKSDQLVEIQTVLSCYLVVQYIPFLQPEQAQRIDFNKRYSAPLILEIDCKKRFILAPNRSPNLN